MLLIGEISGGIFLVYTINMLLTDSGYILTLFSVDIILEAWLRNTSLPLRSVMFISLNRLNFVLALGYFSKNLRKVRIPTSSI